MESIQMSNIKLKFMDNDNDDDDDDDNNNNNNPISFRSINVQS